MEKVGLREERREVRDRQCRWEGQENPSMVGRNVPCYSNVLFLGHKKEKSSHKVLNVLKFIQKKKNAKCPVCVHAHVHCLNSRQVKMNLRPESTMHVL